jgi:hypothetical protein
MAKGKAASPEQSRQNLFAISAGSVADANAAAVVAARRDDDRAGGDHDRAGRHNDGAAGRDDGAARAGATGVIDAAGAYDGVGRGDVSDDHAEGEEAEKSFFHGRFL